MQLKYPTIKAALFNDLVEKGCNICFRQKIQDVSPLTSNGFIFIIVSGRGDSMKTKQLQKRFFELCEGYAQQTGAFACEKITEKKRCSAELTYRTARIQLIYRPKETLGAPPSTLYCRVYPDKNSPLWLQLPQLFSLLELREYRAVYFPYIENTQRMDACFQALTDILSQLLPELEKLGSSGEDRALLTQWIQKEANWTSPEEILREGSFQQRNFLSYLDAVETMHLVRFTHYKPWYFYLLGDRNAALKQYHREKSLSEYEQQLCVFLETPDSAGFVPISDECFALRDKDNVTSGKDDMGTVGLCALVLFGVFGVLLCLIMGLLQVISAWGTECWFGAPWYSGALLAALPAMFGGIAMRRQLIPLLFPKKASRQLDFDDIISDTPLVRRLSWGAFAVTAAFALVMIPVFSGGSVQLYDTHGTINQSLFDRQHFTYDQVEAIYHIQSRYNDFGDRLELDSYVIATADGQLTDLYGFASGKETREKAIPLFLNAGIPIIELDSDRELPAATNTASC